MQEDRALKSKLFIASRVSRVPTKPPQGNPEILQPNILNFSNPKPGDLLLKTTLDSSAGSQNPGASFRGAKITVLYYQSLQKFSQIKNLAIFYVVVITPLHRFHAGRNSAF